MSEQQVVGTVKWFDEQKGFGFIVPEDGGNDIFVHISAVQSSGLQTLKEEQKVSYEIYHDERKGKDSASNLSVVE